MADQDIKSAVQDIDCPVFVQPAFTIPPPLEEATVAIVTSASLHHPDWTRHGAIILLATGAPTLTTQALPPI